MRVWLDHFVVAIDDLDTGIADFEARTGVRPAYGGEHPTLGTHNALVSLGEGQYLEVLAPRTGADLHDMVRDVGKHDTLTPFLWACATDDIEALHDALVSIDLDVGEVTEGSRLTEDGDAVRWRMCLPGGKAPPNAPFFIEWHLDTRHPSEVTPGGCTLESFSITAPDATGLDRMLDAAGLEASVQEGAAAISISLGSPRGPVRLGP